MGYRPESVVFDFRADQTGLAVVGAKPAAHGLGKGQKVFIRLQRAPDGKAAKAGCRSGFHPQ